MSGYWRRKAGETIEAVITAWFTAQGRKRGPLSQLKAAEAEELFRQVNAAYPFGERTSYPYDVWRSEMRALRVRLRLPVPPQKQRKRGAGITAADASVCSGQLGLDLQESA